MGLFQATMRTPFAVLGIRTRGGMLSGIDFLPPDHPLQAPLDPAAAAACEQIAAYLADPGQAFDLPLDAAGTAFQKRVWRALRAIPPGNAVSYGELALSLGSGPRAVGQACRANPLPIVVPCHRVLAKGGLGGFMGRRGGEPLTIKTWLLHHERCRQ